MQTKASWEEVSVLQDLAFEAIFGPNGPWDRRLNEEDHIKAVDAIWAEHLEGSGWTIDEVITELERIVGENRKQD